MKFPILSLVIWMPIIVSALLSMLSSKHFKYIRPTGVLVTFLNLLLSIWLYINFDITNLLMQNPESILWFGNISYELGIDGVSLPLVMLTNLISFITLLSTSYDISKNIKQYIVYILLIQGFTLGIFISTNAILFYMFWEAALIPMYLLIGIWGGNNKNYAAIKLFIYTFFGSLLLLLSIIYLGYISDDYNIKSMYQLGLPQSTQELLFLCMFVGFAVKIPMFPVHTWLPHAHTQAPTGGSIILAALMLKMGAYGFLRFVLPIVPDACLVFAPYMIALSLIAIIYIAYIALTQNDLKKLIAYSSISHMGFVTLGMFLYVLISQDDSFDESQSLSLDGAYIIMISHAFISSGLFIGAGYLAKCTKSRDIKSFGGLAAVVPVFSSFFMLFSLANIGLPGTAGFVGEFMIIISAMQYNFWIALAACTNLFLGASYTLWMYKRVFYGEITNDSAYNMNDVRGFNLVSFIILSIFIIFLGLYPQWLIDIIHPSIIEIISGINN